MQAAARASSSSRSRASPSEAARSSCAGLVVPRLSARSSADARAGAIHVLVNNTGIGVRAAFEDTDQAELRHIFKTNFFDT